MRKELLDLLNEARKNLKNNSIQIKNNAIWVKFETTKNDIDKVAATKNPLVKEYINIHKDAEKNPNSTIGRMAQEMRRVVIKMESYTAAAEMCENDADKKELLDAREKLSNDPAIKKYEKYLEGLKYLAGATNELSPEIEEFFREELAVPIQPKTEMYEKYRVGDDNIEREIERLTENETKMKQMLSEIERELRELNEKERTNGTMHPKLLEAIDKEIKDENDRIRLEKKIQEALEKKTQEALEEKEEPLTEQEKKRLDEVRSAKGLNNIRVKAFEKKYGSEERLKLIQKMEKVEKDISVISKIKNNLSKKYSPEIQEKLNEYQKVIAPLKARELFAKQAFCHEKLTRNFIGDYLTKPDRVTGNPFGDRQTPGTMCIAMMLLKGYKVEDIMNPTALLDVKKEIGQEYIKRREAKDIKWYSKTMYDGGFAMMDAFKQYVKDHKKELRTEKDLTIVAGTLGTLAMTCFDVFQELKHCKGTYKTDEEYEFLTGKIGGYVIAAVGAQPQTVRYDKDSFSPEYIAGEMNRQMQAKLLLDEIQKDNPNIEDLIMSPDIMTQAPAQLTSMPEFNAIYPDNSDILLEDIDKETAKKLAFMQTMDFVHQNDIRVDKTKYTVKAKNSPESVFHKIKIGEQLECVVSRGGKQLVATDIAVKVEDGLKSIFNRKIISERSKNSDQFNAMMDEYKKALPNIKAGNNDMENIAALQNLKEAAKNYILAKRMQKGYKSQEMLDNDVDLKMLGKEKGGRSIFTTKGKDRYEFAVNILTYVTGLEKTQEEYQKQQEHLEFVKNEQKEIKNAEQGGMENKEKENDLLNHTVISEEELNNDDDFDLN